MWYRTHEMCSVLFFPVGPCSFGTALLLIYGCCRGRGFVKTVLIDILYMLIPVSFNGKALFLQFDVEKGADTGVDNCKQRYADNHSQYAHQTAKQRDGKDDPEAGESCRASKNLGPQNIAVKLLQQQNEENEVQAV